MDNINIRTILLIVGVIITGSIEHITIPIMVTYFESLYFILIITSIEGCINFGIILLIITRGHIELPKSKKIVILAGVFNALMSMCFIYSANPNRTPVVIQSIFLGLAVLPTVMFRKLLLNKNTKYNLRFTGLSIVFLIASVVIAVVPLFSKNKLTSYYWIFGYILAIILMSLDNTMQEKYVVETNDNSVKNKITLAFFTSLCQIITLLLMFWVELIFGYTDKPIESFINSASSFFGNVKNFFLMQLFIYDCLALYLLSIYLNVISTNYNMILTNLTNQSVAIFFTIFPGLNNGLKYDIKITVVSLALNIISVILWILGEKNELKHEIIAECKEIDNETVKLDENNK